MQPLPFSRPLIKISGEALLGRGQYGIDLAVLESIAGDIGRIARGGLNIALVIGGGNIFRGVSGAASGMDRVKGDFMGMLATVMNALAFEQALLRQGQSVRVYSGLPVPSVCETFHRDRAKADLDAGKIVILAGGTGNPFFTTDTTAALRAAELGCDAILKATQVDGIYSADPKAYAHAKRYDRLTYSDVLAQNLKVMDAAAIALARDNNIPIVVFSLKETGAIEKVVRGEAVCSIVEGGLG
jgi:uridylate kinase